MAKIINESEGEYEYCKIQFNLLIYVINIKICINTDVHSAKDRRKKSNQKNKKKKGKYIV